MKTLLLVKLAFLPVILFGVLSAFGEPQWALDLGAAAGVMIVGLHLANRRNRPMEAAMALSLAGMAVGAHLRPGDAALIHAEAANGLLLVQALVGFGSVALRRPWTSVYAATEFAHVRATPTFGLINMVLSGMWSAIFLGLAVVGHWHLGAIASTVLVGIGILVSLFGPRGVTSLLLTLFMRQQETFHWTMPDLRAPKAEGEVDVAIIGAGLGGLTAAALLAQAGLKVVVAEHHVVPGGFAHSWLRKVHHDGQPRLFRFDSGVHDVSGAHPDGPVARLFARLGVDVEWLRLQQSTTVAGKSLAVAEDWRAHARNLGSLHPESADGIMRFFEAAKRIYDQMMSIGADHCGVPILPKTMAALMEYPRNNPDAMRWMSRPFAELVAAHVPDAAAQEVLYGLAGYVTDRPADLLVSDMVPLYGYYFYGGYYPKGGSGVLGDGLARAVVAHGSEVLLKTPVERILVENGMAVGIRLASGREIRARIVISNADLKRTMLDLLPPDALNTRLRARFAAAEPATSAFMVHLALDQQLDMTPIASARGADGLAVGLVAPSLVDPTAAPDGFATLELITLVPHANALAWFPDAGATDDRAHRASPDYAAAKAAMGDRLIAAAETLLPGLSGHIVARYDASPLTFARYDWSSAGSIYGLAKGSRIKGSKSPVPGLFLAGHGNMGPGVEAVMIAGARVADAILPGLLSRPAPAPAPSVPAVVALAG